MSNLKLKGNYTPGFILSENNKMKLVLKYSIKHITQYVDS